MGKKPEFTELSYSSAIQTSASFISRLLKAFSIEVTQAPAAIRNPSYEIYKTPIVDELNKYELTKVAQLMERSLTKLKKGQSQEAVDDLRGALEIFTMEIAKRFDDKAHKQDKVSANIEILKTAGVVPERIVKLLDVIYAQKIKGLMSDYFVHKREDLPERDVQLIYDHVEMYMKYVIDKAVAG
jgi:hypothetical protein